MKPLSLVQILVYSAGTLGSNLVYAFANFAFPLYLRHYPVSNVLVGFLAQERSFVGAFVQPVVGAVSDRVPPNPLGRRRPFFLVGVPLTAIALIFLSFAPPLWTVIAVMTVFSFFLAVANDPYMALLPDIVPSEQRGRVGGVMGTFMMLGAMATLLLSSLLWEEQRQLLFFLVAAGLVLFFSITFFGVKEPPITARPPRVKGDKRGWRKAGRIYLAEFFAHREIVKYLAATFFFWLGNGGIAPFLTRFGVDIVGTDESAAFQLVIFTVVGSALFAVPAGLLTEHFGKKPVLNVGMFAFGSIAVVGGLLVTTETQARVLLSLVGVANAITNALIFPLLADLIPRDRAGEFTGVGQMVSSLSQTLGALGAGLMVDLTGTLRGAFALGGLFMLTGFTIMITVRVPDPPPRRRWPTSPPPSEEQFTAEEPASGILPEVRVGGAASAEPAVRKARMHRP